MRGAVQRLGRAAVLAVAAGLLSSAVVAAPALAVRDDRGRTVVLAAPPQRIVSLLPSLTESVCALDACDRLVGVDPFSNWPERVKALPKLGGLDDTPVERLVALKPDLVLAATSHRVLDRLESLGLKVVAMEPRNLAQVHSVLQRLGDVLERREQAEALWQGIEARTAAAAARVPPAWKGAKAYVEVSSAPYAAGEGSFVGELLQRLGLGNVVPAALGPFPKLNPEFVVRAQPDVLIASEGAGRAGDDFASRPGWSAIPALQRGQRCAIPSARWQVLMRPGPRLAEGADALVDCLVALPRRG